MEVTDLNWRKASYSNGGANACIEVANNDHVMVRDSKDKDGARLAFTTSAWKAFTAKVKRSLTDPVPIL
jgi:Domain of unknown function (DUF397)